MAALFVDYTGTYFGGARGWRVRFAAHFAERHGLIVIIALGESIVAIGVGVARLPTSWPIVTASTLGLAFRWRTTGRLSPALPAAALVIASFAWWGAALPALATLAAVTLVIVAVVAVETRRAPVHPEATAPR